MSFASHLRKITDEQRPIAEKKTEKIRKVKHLLFEKISNMYLEEIYNNIENAKKYGKCEKFMNYNRCDFKINISGAGTPAEIFREWLCEVKNPKSMFLVTSKTGENICLDGINSFVLNNQKFTTEFSWNKSGCPHVNRECNCYGFNQTSANMSDRFLFNVSGRMYIAPLCM